ncbi:hypothetical protein CBL_02878 [Carabus blaptoides fortunei]
MSGNLTPGSSKDVHKNPSGMIVKSGQRFMTYNVYLKHTNEGLSKTIAMNLTAEEVGLSSKLIFDIVREMERTGILKSPKKTRNRSDFYSKLTEDEKKAVRHNVHSFFKINEIPTLDKVFQAAKENEFISPMSRSTLFKCSPTPSS